MRSWIVILAWWGAGAWTVPSSGWTAEAGPIRSPESSRAAFVAAERAAVSAVRAYADSLAAVGDFSGALLIARDGVPLLRHACGMADRDEERPNRPDTKFNLGSINKLFTKIAVLQLAERGMLSLDATIDGYLADYPVEKGSEITTRMLLDHRAGTGDIFGPGYFEARSRLRTINDYYGLIRDQTLDFEPGTRRSYSNAGYVILGSIIERVSGQDYYDYVRDHIYHPAGMNRTGSPLLLEAALDVAVGYTRQPMEEETGGEPTLHPNKDFLPARGSSAGGGYSTCDDLSAFVTSLRAGRLLGPRWTVELVGTDAGLRVAGGAPGVNASLETVGPYTLIVLTNQDPPAAERVARYARERVVALMEAVVQGSGDDQPTTVKRRPTPDDPMERPKRSFVPSDGTEVPMIIMAGHLPAVDVMVNGRGPYRFAVDTGGAGALRVNATLAKKLDMKVVGEAWAGDPSGINRQRRDVVAVDSVQLGSATFVRIDATVREEGMAEGLPGVDGILDFGFFSGQTVTFDYPAGSLRVDPTELPPTNGDDILSYSDEDGIPSITIRVGSVEMPAHVDAGSMGGFVFPERVLRQLPLAAEPKVIGRARTATNSFELKGAQLHGTLRIGGIEFIDPALEFQPIMPDVNVGSRVLKDFRVSFDTRNKRIRFTRAS